MGLDNPLHIAVLVVIILLLFGAKRLPEIGRSLGTGMREFKDSISGDSKQPAITQAPAPSPPAAQVVPTPAQASAQQAADAFGSPAGEQRVAPVEPTPQP